MNEQMEPRKLIVNLDGWYVPGLGSMPKGRVIVLDEINNPKIKERILVAFHNKEKGYCRKEKAVVRAVLNKKEEQDIINDNVRAASQTLLEQLGDKITEEELGEFKIEMRSKVGKKKKKKITSDDIKDEIKEESKKDKVKDKDIKKKKRVVDDDE